MPTLEEVNTWVQDRFNGRKLINIRFNNNEKTSITFEFEDSVELIVHTDPDNLPTLIVSVTPKCPHGSHVASVRTRNGSWTCGVCGKFLPKTIFDTLLQ